METQVFHAPTKPSKPFWKDPAALEFASRSCSGSKFFVLDSEILKFAAESVKKEGLWVELGVASGRTICFLAKLFPHQTIYGFDSFEGLPEEWVRGDGSKPKGTYSQERLPEVPHNVKLIKGWFNDTLPPFAAANKEPIAFLHMDCDLFSSTKEAFFVFKDQILPGTVILFDEYYNYPGCEAHEMKAFQEFLEAKSYSFQILAFNAMHEQVAVQIT